MKMNKLLLMGLFCLFSVLAKAEVQLQIETTQISMDEPFQISVIQDNPKVGNGIPDLTPLRKDFFIVGTARSVNYSIINGVTQSSSTWAITLKALKTGTFTIPPIKVGDEQTNPLTITVTASTQPNNRSSNNTIDSQQKDILLTTEVVENQPYVNQQITYKVKLYNSKQLLDAKYEAPKVENALLIPLGGGKQYQTQKNGTQYLVEEQIYAIFPQKSGPLTITSPVFTALVYNFEPQRIKVEDKNLTLNIQPIPKNYTGAQWLPAKQVSLKETYEHVEQTLSQGSTLIRTIRLEGAGIPAQLLPTLNFAQNEAFNIYPEKGKEKNQIIQGELVGTTEIKVTYLFNKSGKITIPKLKLPWFNITTGKEEIASLASKTLEITPSVTAISKTSSPKEATEINESSIEPKEISLDLPLSHQNYWPWLIAIFFALAWIVTLGKWKWQKYHPNKTKRSYKKTLNELHQACLQGNPQSARDALLKWAKKQWPDASILSLGDITSLLTDPQLKKQIHILSQVLYQDAKKSLWRGDELWRTIQSFKPLSYEHQNKNYILPPINP
jgi:hypothetical protein